MGRRFVVAACAALGVLSAASLVAAQPALRGSQSEDPASSDPLAAWEAYKEQRRRQGLPIGGEPGPVAGYAAAPPTFLAPSAERALLNDLRRMNEEERLALELLAQRKFGALTEDQKVAMHATARNYYSSLPPSRRAYLREERRKEYRSLSPAERSAWRYDASGGYRALVERQRYIFLAQAQLEFGQLPGAERANLLLTAGRVLDQRQRAAQQAAKAGLPADSGAVQGPPALRLSPEEQMRFRSMTPEQQRRYLDQLGARDGSSTP